MMLAEDWKICGADAFTFCVLDTLKKDPNKTLKEFKEELQELADMYRNERPAELSY
jgi:hypothetical protein